MTTSTKTKITVSALIHAPVEKVWLFWTNHRYIIHWNNASDDWHTPKSENDLKVGGRFLSRMEARDGSSGFDFTGKYGKVHEYRLIEYTLDDGRNVKISFVPDGNITTVTEEFEAEQENPAEMQKEGWQAILDNFKRFVESPHKQGVMHFEVTVGTTADKVYHTMLDDNTYSEWTSVFDPTSHFKGSWEKGSKILFLSSDNDGALRGMVSRIKENVPIRFLSIEHVGIVEKGKETLSGKKVTEWAGALENYTFTEKNGTTLLEIDVDVNEKYRSYFEVTWPKALDKLKEICEK
jgi:uncharacterized protein YndB with AHSA1/START domain